jgi:hypothetical protein
VTPWFRYSLSVDRPFRLSVPHELYHASVFTPRSSNRTGAFNASSSRRKVHGVAHGRLLVRLVRQTKPSTSCSVASGNAWSPAPALCAWHTATDAASYERVYPPLGRPDGSETEVVSPSDHHAVEFRHPRLLGQHGFTPSGLVADHLTDALNALLRRHCADVSTPRLRRVATSKRVSSPGESHPEALAEPGVRPVVDHRSSSVSRDIRPPQSHIELALLYFRTDVESPVRQP